MINNKRYKFKELIILYKKFPFIGDCVFLFALLTKGIYLLKLLKENNYIF